MAQVVQLRLRQELSASQSSRAKTANAAAQVADSLTAVSLDTVHVLLPVTATHAWGLVCYGQLAENWLDADIRTEGAGAQQTSAFHFDEECETQSGSHSCR